LPHAERKDGEQKEAPIGLKRNFHRGGGRSDIRKVKRNRGGVQEKKTALRSQESSNARASQGKRKNPSILSLKVLEGRDYSEPSTKKAIAEKDFQQMPTENRRRMKKRR